jgi:hypothetical protein
VSGIFELGPGSTGFAAPQFVRLFRGERPEVTVTADTRGLDRGLRCSTLLTFTGNTAAPARAALSFRVAFPARALLLHGLGFGALGMALATAYRLLVGRLGGRSPDQWLAATPPPRGLALEFAILPVALAVWIAVRKRRRK